MCCRIGVAIAAAGDDPIVQLPLGTAPAMADLLLKRTVIPTFPGVISLCSDQAQIHPGDIQTDRLEGELTDPGTSDLIMVIIIC
ncbi:hypothetical protein QR680_000180 [Steinernema hermaphroditum]|uniref:Uncharacterized protein n=1 Tax=Steinernema hermaphroditum TaxID=289476 RepID=A0AA39LD56_9BILA|nr:hypothetical protein QR680_000180 [Steinernema hermaphroditum]